MARPDTGRALVKPQAHAAWAQFSDPAFPTPPAVSPFPPFPPLRPFPPVPHSRASCFSRPSRDLHQTDETDQTDQTDETDQATLEHECGLSERDRHLTGPQAATGLVERTGRAAGRI